MKDCFRCKETIKMCKIDNKKMKTIRVNHRKSRAKKRWKRFNRRRNKRKRRNRSKIGRNVLRPRKSHRSLLKWGHRSKRYQIKRERNNCTETKTKTKTMKISIYQSLFRNKKQGRKSCQSER